MNTSVVAHRREVYIGAILAVVTAVIVMLLPKPQALDLLALILVFAAAVYIGFVLLDCRRKERILELAAFSLCAAAALLGLWFSPLILAAGFLAHGLWDSLHHPKAIQTRVVQWVPPFCLIYDWLVAVFIVWWWHPLI